jgi:tetratricopeptide (TPR) repeat protein
VKAAIGFYRDYIAFTRETGNRHGEGVGLGNLGLAYAALSDINRAIELLEQQLRITREISDRRGEARALWNISQQMYKCGNLAQAIANAESSLKIREELQDPSAYKVRQKLAEWRTAAA